MPFLVATLLMTALLVRAQDANKGAAGSTPVRDKDGAYQIGPGVTAPVLTKPVAPEVPPTADDRVPSRRFQFLVVVDADGTIKLRDVIPNDSSRYLENAIVAVKQSTFQAGALNGLPVPVLVCVGVAYSPFRPASTQIVDCDQQLLRGAGGGLDTSVEDPFKAPPGAKAPVPTHTVFAEYSNEARAQRIEGVVLVSLIVNEQGMPTDIRVVRPAGHGLDENAVAAVSQYRFRPATLDGKPIAVRIKIAVSFRLRD